MVEPNKPQLLIQGNSLVHPELPNSSAQQPKEAQQEGAYQ